MKTPKTHLLLAALAVSIPAFALAQVVPPPTPPGRAVVPATPSVAPPTSVTSANPAAAAPAPPSAPPQTLIDIALPDAPKAPPAVDLKPAAPRERTRAKTTAPPRVPAEEAQRAKPLDPFAGLIGTPVSDSQLNRFVFPDAVEGVFFPEGAPVPECPDKAGPMDPCRPVFFNGKRVMLLQLRAGAKGPVQMLVHLASGRFVELNLMPAAGPAALVRVDGAEDGASDARLMLATRSAGADSAGGRNSMAASEQYVALLGRFASGDIPAGFETTALGERVRFDRFDVIPMASWSDGANLRAHLLQVQAHGEAQVLINAAFFRHANVRALALDREVITKSAPAQLYMLEFVPTEGQ